MSVPSLSLEGQIAIVTGGGTGIGRNIALEFAEAGANVVVASRRLTVLEKVATEVIALGKRSLAVRTDVTQKSDVDNMVQRVVGEFGRIDILVNNAGTDVRAPLLDLREDGWDRVINTDLKGYYLCCQAVGKRMVERRKGNIINMASTAAIKAGEKMGVYCIAKAGVIMLTKVLALELASYNIRVNAIAPGWGRTKMTEWLWSNPEFLKQMEAVIPLGRIAEPSDVANAALFLASDISSYITGTTLVVDGGFHLP